MKFIYTILLFLIFFNVFSFLLVGLNIIPYEVSHQSDAYTPDMTGEGLFENLSTVNFETITTLSLDNLDLLVIVAGGLGMALLMRSPAPFAVGLFLGVFINTFRKSIAIMQSFDINQHIVTAAIVGVIFLFIITMIEYFTQGDA